MASIYFEVECEVEGKIVPGDASVGEYGPGVEDADISSVSVLYAERVPNRQPGAYPYKTKNIDLLDGLDEDARQTVIRNIFKLYADDIDRAILDDA
jgi:hypothetical protein